MADGETKYRMKCPVCGQALEVDSLSARVPKHPAKAQRQGVANVPCAGSGQRGIIAGTKARRIDDLKP